MAADLLPSPFPPAALPQLDILDDALAEYLDALELYQLAQQKLADQLKQVRRAAKSKNGGGGGAGATSLIHPHHSPSLPHYLPSAD